MQRYFGKSKDNNIIYLNEADYNHIKNVMRFKENDNIIVVYDSIVYLTSLNNDLKSVNIINELEYSAEDYYLRLYVPIVIEEKMDFILQKGTELGVKEFIPVYMERCKFKIDKEKEEKKINRWTKICKEASEQSERNYIPKVSKIIKVKDIENNADKLIICSLDKDNSITIKEAFENKNKNDIINVIFGPEGGITKEEEEYLSSIGYKRVCFGNQILRCETTPLFISSIIKYIYMDSKWYYGKYKRIFD